MAQGSSEIPSPILDCSPYVSFYKPRADRFVLQNISQNFNGIVNLQPILKNLIESASIKPYDMVGIVHSIVYFFQG